MGFTVLILRVPIGKLIATSNYDKKLHVAAISKTVQL